MEFRCTILTLVGRMLSRACVHCSHAQPGTAWHTPLCVPHPTCTLAGCAFRIKLNLQCPRREGMESSTSCRGQEGGGGHSVGSRGGVQLAGRGDEQKQH